MPNSRQIAKRILSTCPIFLGIALAGCAGTELPTHHRYVLPIAPRAITGAPARLDLEVARFSGEGFARGTTIWARISDLEMEPWQTHSWALPVPDLVTMAVIDWARASGRFKNVEAVNGAKRGKGLRLEGVIQAFEEVDETDQWLARVRCRLFLGETGTTKRQLLWSGTIEERVPADSRNPQALVRAFGKALEKVMDQAAAQWPL